MLSSAARVSTSGTLVQDTCLRKRHRSDQSKGFSCDSKTADPLSMPTAGKSSETHYQKINEETKQMENGFCKNLLISLASLSDKGGPIRHHQSPLPPIFARLSTSEVGRAKKDDDWLVRNQGNFLPFSQKGKWHFYENAIFIYFPVYYKSCQSFEVFGCLSFFAAGGFDYDPDQTLHESHLEEKDEKYFAMKGNSSFEAEKGIKCFDNMYLYVF